MMDDEGSRAVASQVRLEGAAVALEEHLQGDAADLPAPACDVSPDVVRGSPRTNGAGALASDPGSLFDCRRFGGVVWN